MSPLRSHDSVFLNRDNRSRRWKNLSMGEHEANAAIHRNRRRTGYESTCCPPVRFFARIGFYSARFAGLFDGRGILSERNGDENGVRLVLPKFQYPPLHKISNWKSRVPAST